MYKYIFSYLNDLEDLGYLQQADIDIALLIITYVYIYVYIYVFIYIYINMYLHTLIVYKT